jgi:hypothetical protein
MSVSAYTGPLDPAKRKHADENILAFLAGLKERKIRAIAVLTNGSVGERFIYRVSRAERAVLVRFPGVPLAQIRVDDEASGGSFEELHIDGVGLSWTDALNLVAKRLGSVE